MLDQPTLSVVTALVVIVAGIVYLVETLLRKDGRAGQLWSVAFLAGMVTVLAYLIWAVHPGAFVAVAIGNAAFVASAGFVWLGCRAFNDRRLRVPAPCVGAGAVAVFGAVLVTGPDGGDWAGALPTFLAIAAFAGCGAVETRRGSLGARWNAFGLSFVLALESVFFAARAVALVSAGPESDLFRFWLGPQAASLVTVVLTVVAAVTLSVLRATEANLRGHRDTLALTIGLDGVMLQSSFATAVSMVIERARSTGETVCVVAVRIDDPHRLLVAFGPGETETILSAWRAAVFRHTPTGGMVGEYGDRTLLTAFLTNSSADLRRIAALIHRRVLDVLAELDTSVVPTVGIGVATTERIGYDFAALAAAADRAAERSVTSSDASVIVADS